jgi:hypothetical protein
MGKNKGRFLIAASASIFCNVNNNINANNNNTASSAGGVAPDSVKVN